MRAHSETYLHKVASFVDCFLVFGVRPASAEVKECRGRTADLSDVQTLNHVTITSSCGAKRYATALVFYEKQSNAPRWLPLAFCLISKSPLFEQHRKCLARLHESYRGAKATSSSIGRSGPTYSMEFYLSLIFSISTCSFRDSVALVSHRKGRVQTFLRIGNYSSGDMSVPQVPLHALLLAVPAEGVLKLATLLLMERKVIIVRKNPETNAILIECLLQLLSPLYNFSLFLPRQWEFANISYLTKDLIDYIDAPTPYIVGVTPAVWESATRRRRADSPLPPDIAVYDADRDVLSCKDPPPVLPKRVKERIIDCLRGVAERSRSFGSDDEDADMDDILWISVRERMYKSFLELLGGFLPFLSKPGIEESSVSRSSVFQFPEYLNSLNEENLPFMREFSKTQMFTNFVERAYRARTQRNEASFFVQCADSKGTSGRTGLGQVLLSAKMKAVQLCRNPSTISLEACHLQYVSTLCTAEPKCAAKRTHDGTAMLAHAEILSPAQMNIGGLAVGQTKRHHKNVPSISSKCNAPRPPSKGKIRPPLLSSRNANRPLKIDWGTVVSASSGREGTTAKLNRTVAAEPAPPAPEHNNKGAADEFFDVGEELDIDGPRLGEKMREKQITAKLVQDVMANSARIRERARSAGSFMSSTGGSKSPTARRRERMRPSEETIVTKQAPSLSARGKYRCSTKVVGAALGKLTNHAGNGRGTQQISRTVRLGENYMPAIPSSLLTIYTQSVVASGSNTTRDCGKRKAEVTGSFGKLAGQYGSNTRNKCCGTFLTARLPPKLADIDADCDHDTSATGGLM